MSGVRVSDSMQDNSTLTPDQLHKVDQLKAAVAGVVEVPSYYVRNTIEQIASLKHACLRLFCTEATYLRYMRARNWNLQNAIKMLKNTLEWRLTFKPQEIRWDEIAPEAATGKQVRLSHPDRAGRVVVLMRPRAENTRGHERQMRFLVYTLEAACRRADESGVAKMTWLIDFEGYSMRNAPSIKASVQTMQILQNHYPERLGHAVCFHPPRLFSITWKAVQPFIDPVTYKKIDFVSEKDTHLMADFFDMDSLETCLGGSSGETYDFKQYGEMMRKEDVLLDQALSKMTQGC